MPSRSICCILYWASLPCLIAEALVTLRRGQFGDITESKSRIRTATTSVGFWTACSPIARKLATMSDERVGAKRSIRRLLRQIGLPARRGFPDWRFTSRHLSLPTYRQPCENGDAEVECPSHFALSEFAATVVRHRRLDRSRAGGRHDCHTKALWPVMSRPTINDWISAVPSYVTRLSMSHICRMTWKSSVMPLPPRTSRAIRHTSRALTLQ